MATSPAPLRRHVDPSLRARISSLRLPLAPLMPMPSGLPHPDFPQTLLGYHLLTEDQLDRLAHHYHQSTPGIYTNEYPMPVLWPRRRSSGSLLSPRDTDSKRRRSTGSPTTSSPSQSLSQSLETATQQSDDWLATLLSSVTVDPALHHPSQASQTTASERRWSDILRDDNERIAIKRRKIGKFIGLVGMQTPAAEVESRMRHDIERVMRVARRDRRREEERETAGRKWRS
ncbi:Hypothetical protein D9617_17g046840 [Elsinoe fawcettii]|nr:Hypothetical protein D9617_17g046840 [Elsinoe fawcettii]